MQSHGIKKQFKHEMTPWGLAATQGEGCNLTFLGNWYAHFPVDLGCGQSSGCVFLTMVVLAADCPYSYRAGISISTWTFT